jgi:hypothetical protein
MSADATADLPLTISWFETAKPEGPAYGDPERTTWGAFTSAFEWRREGEKDGPAFVPSRFKLGPNGRQIRRRHRQVVVGKNSGPRDGWSLAGDERDYAAIVTPVICAQTLKA